MAALPSGSRLNESTHEGLAPIAHRDAQIGAVDMLYSDGAAVARTQLELLEVPIGRDEVGERAKPRQPIPLQVETKRVERKRDAAADAFDEGFLQRPDGEERGGKLIGVEGLQIAKLRRREET